MSQDARRRLVLDVRPHFQPGIHSETRVRDGQTATPHAACAAARCSQRPPKNRSAFLGRRYATGPTDGLRVATAIGYAGNIERRQISGVQTSPICNLQTHLVPGRDGYMNQPE
jgi:hypothetical protein